MMIAVRQTDAKHVTRRLTAHHVKHRRLRGYWAWRLAAFDVPPEAWLLIGDLIVADPDRVAGCDWLGNPPGTEYNEVAPRDPKEAGK